MRYLIMITLLGTMAMSCYEGDKSGRFVTGTGLIRLDSDSGEMYVLYEDGENMRGAVLQGISPSRLFGSVAYGTYSGYVTGEGTRTFSIRYFKEDTGVYETYEATGEFDVVQVNSANLEMPPASPGG